MLLGEVDREFVDDISGVAAECTEKRTISIHDNEAELLVGFKQLAQCLGVEFVVAQVKGGVDRFEGLKVNIDFSFLAFRSNDFPTVDDKAIWRDLVVELKALLRGCDCRKNRKAIYSRLDVRRSALGLSAIASEKIGIRVRILQPTSLLLLKLGPWVL